MISVFYYAVLNFVAHGNVISDAVTATTFFAALYLGITGIAAAWHYRSSLSAGIGAAFSRVVMPALSAVALYTVLAWSIKTYLDPSQSYTVVTLPIIGQVGGTMLIAVITVIVGLGWMLYCERTEPEFFSGESLQAGVSLTDDDEIVELKRD